MTIQERALTRLGTKEVLREELAGKIEGGEEDPGPVGKLSLLNAVVTGHLRLLKVSFNSPGELLREFAG